MPAPNTRTLKESPPDTRRPRDFEDQLAEARRFTEAWIDHLLPPASSSPTRLHLAMREAVFPGGKRVRPLLSRLVADTYGEGDRDLVGRLAAAVELVHCASLVHDDLPAFDDADTRRGHPSCHAMFGEATAILVGDALLTLAFEAVSGAREEEARAAIRLVRMLAEATGSRRGIIGGQGLELQTNIDVDAYHSQKTAALFRAAAGGGAIAAGHPEDASRWLRFGELLGCALQLRDDLDDCTGTAEECGKPVGQDAAHNRPNAVTCSSAGDVKRRLRAISAEARAILGEPGESTSTLHALVSMITGVSGNSADSTASATDGGEAIADGDAA